MNFDFLTPFLPLALVFLSLLGYFLGGWVRGQVHVLMPYKDPLTIIIFAAFLCPVWLEVFFHIHLCNITGMWYISAIVGFTAPYCLSYFRTGLDIVYVNVHTIVSDEFPGGCQKIHPMIYAQNNMGQMYVQEQSMKEILKTVFLHIYCPLKFPMGQIQRTRPVFVEKPFFPRVVVDAVDVVDEKITTLEVQKGPFTFHYRSYVYTPAPSCIDSTSGWLVSAYNQQSLTQELTRKEGQILEAKTSAISNLYGKSGDLLVEMIADRTPSADVYNDVISRLCPDDDEDIPVIEPQGRPMSSPRTKRSTLRKQKGEREPKAKKSVFKKGSGTEAQEAPRPAPRPAPVQREEDE